MPLDTVWVTLSREELFLLAQWLKLPGIPGLADDELRMLPREALGMVLLTAEHALLARGVMHPTLTGVPRLDPAIAALFGNGAMPEYSAVTTAILRGPVLDARNYHRYAVPPQLVEHARPARDVHTFTRLPVEARLPDVLSAALRLDGQPAAEGVGGTVPLAVLMAARDNAIAGGIDAATSALVTGGLPATDSAAFIRTLGSLTLNSSFLGLNHQQRQADGFAVVGGSGGLWLLVELPTPKPGENAYVAITPASVESIHDRLTKMLP